MATRIADGRNKDKTKLEAQSSKVRVAEAKAALTEAVECYGRGIEQASERSENLACSICLFCRQT